jgi:predicted PhzF superfamily epimerase YddE/YHI9
LPALHVLEVFVSPDGEGGNGLGVFLEGGEVPEPERQRVAHELGFSETVFVDDAPRGEIRIFTPASELPFAGHPCVGTAWLLRRERGPVDALRPPPGEIPVRYEDGDLVWIAARREWCPPFEFFHLDAPEEVDALTEPPAGSGMAYCWAWEDERAGRMRARGLFPAEDIAEDEATGSAAIALSADLGRPLEIRQGRGSRMSTRLRGDGYVEVGGLTRPVEEREIEPSLLR